MESPHRSHTAELLHHELLDQAHAIRHFAHVLAHLADVHGDHVQVVADLAKKYRFARSLSAFPHIVSRRSARGGLLGRNAALHGGAHRIGRPLEPADLSNVVPQELRADLLVLLLNGEPVLVIIGEAQLPRDPRKTFTWPAYVVGAYARFRCPACVLVFTPDTALAARLPASAFPSRLTVLSNHSTGAPCLLYCLKLPSN